MQDLRYVIRTLLRSPSFALSAVGTLAIGIAVNTTVFTLLNALALRPMPVRDPGGVVRLLPVDARGHRHNLWSFPDYGDYQAAVSGIAELTAYIPIGLTARVGSADPEDLVGYVVAASYFPLLGIEMSLGRGFQPAEDSAGADHEVAVISHSLWRRRYGSDPSAVGSSIVLNDRRFRIVGVGPARFRGTEPLAPDVWVTIAAQPTVAPETSLSDRSSSWLLIVGRVAPGVASATAAAALSTTASRLASAFPGADRPVAVAVVAGRFFPLDPALWPVVVLVLVIVALVLAVACANVANLLLARASGRQRELAVRLAVGATRWRVARLLITEALVVSLAGGAAGLLLSGWILDLAYPVGLSLVPSEWGTVVLELAPDVRVFSYTMALAVAAGVLLGLVPALQASTPCLTGALHDDGVIIGGLLRRSRLRRGLVVVQVAACLALLVGAGLLARGLQRAQALAIGFDTANIVFTEYDFRRHGSPAARVDAFNRALSDAAVTLPGVTSVASTSHVPLHGGVKRTTVWPEGHAEPVMATTTLISRAYFATLGIPVTRGRTFSDQEASGAPVAVISEQLAARFWPGLDPIGRRLDAANLPVPLTIVGVVRDTSSASLWRDKEMALYIPAGWGDPRDLHLLVRTAGSPHDAAAVLRQRARALDPTLRFAASSLDVLLERWLLPSRVAAIGAILLGLVALVLAAAGLYGVVSHAVALRTREIGIRLALGAQPSDVVRLVLADGIRLIGTGLVAGLAGAIALSQLLRRFVFDLNTVDPLTFLFVPAFLAAVGLLACYIPARRATRAAPLAGLRAP